MLARPRPVQRFLCSAILAWLAVLPGPLAGKEDELPNLQGTWQLIEMQNNGKKDPERSKNYRWIFKDDQYTIFLNDKKTEVWTVKLGDRTIDATLNISPRTYGITIRGIYEVSGDSLRICYDRTGEGRPVDFKAAAGSHHVLYVLKKE